ncbi:MAG: hypothetical protein ACRDD1_20115, partial [Planctomycetia bacterium]
MKQLNLPKVERDALYRKLRIELKASRTYMVTGDLSERALAAGLSPESEVWTHIRYLIPGESRAARSHAVSEVSAGRIADRFGCDRERGSPFGEVAPEGERHCLVRGECGGDDGDACGGVDGALGGDAGLRSGNDVAGPEFGLGVDLSGHTGVVEVRSRDRAAKAGSACGAGVNENGSMTTKRVGTHRQPIDHQIERQDMFRKFRKKKPI